MDDPQLYLFPQGKEITSIEDRYAVAWEFLHDSIAFLDECKYKSVSKHMINAWEKEFKKRGLVRSIAGELFKLAPGNNSMNVLIEFPWEDARHISIWLDDHKERWESLKKKVREYEQYAITKMRSCDEPKHRPASDQASQDRGST